MADSVAARDWLRAKSRDPEVGSQIVESLLAKMEAAWPLLLAVVAIWQHTEKHAEYIEGRGYITTPHIKPCQDPDEHGRLAAAEGKAWHEYSSTADQHSGDRNG